MRIPSDRRASASDQKIKISPGVGTLGVFLVQPGIA